MGIMCPLLNQTLRLGAWWTLIGQNWIMWPSSGRDGRAAQMKIRVLMLKEGKMDNRQIETMDIQHTYIKTLLFLI